MNDSGFDIIIAGAGISGLLLADGLSKRFKVLVIEEKIDIKDDKFWVTTEDCLKGNERFLECIDNKFDQMLFSDAYGKSYEIKGKYILWNTLKLQNILKNNIILNGGVFALGEKFCGYNNESNYITVFSNDKRYNARLLIDCMGYKSPLILSEDIIKIRGYYLIYGAKIKLKRNITPICLSNYILSKSPCFFEVFPTSQKEAYAVLLKPVRGFNSPRDLSKDFSFFIKKSIYSKYFNSEINNIIKGIVPVGTVKKKALNRILFFGESAQNNPSATGTCLTHLFRNYNDFIHFIEQSFDKNTFSARELSKVPEIMNDFSRKLQMIMFEELLDSNSKRFSSYIGYLPKISDETINTFLFGNIYLKDVVSIKKIKKIYKLKDFHVINILLKLLT
ncbi:hypothetical protein CSA08_04965 [Candidatus Gracilibacteria bacterium]|nr:MAG: hypothetical protein CSA08_04965 [Candidatus Gracilibacteria bacterium]